MSSMDQCNAQSRPASLPQHGSIQSVLTTIIQLDSKPPETPQSSNAAPEDFCSAVTCLVKQPEVPDTHACCTLVQQKTGASLTGPSCPGYAGSVSWDGCLLSRAAAAAFPMANGNEALSTDPLSMPASIELLGDLLADMEHPTASVGASVLPRTQVATQAVPITHACTANSQEASAVERGCRQQQAKAAVPNPMPCASENQPMAPTSSLSDLELLASGQTYPDSYLDELLSDLPLDQATDFGGMHGTPIRPVMHSYPDSWREKPLPQRKTSGPSTAMDCNISPSTDSSKAFLANTLDDTSSRPGACDLKPFFRHAEAPHGQCLELEPYFKGQANEWQATSPG